MRGVRGAIAGLHVWLIACHPLGGSGRPALQHAYTRRLRGSVPVILLPVPAEDGGGASAFGGSRHSPRPAGFEEITGRSPMSAPRLAPPVGVKVDAEPASAPLALATRFGSSKMGTEQMPTGSVDPKGLSPQTIANLPASPAAVPTVPPPPTAMSPPPPELPPFEPSGILDQIAGENVNTDAFAISGLILVLSILCVCTLGAAGLSFRAYIKHKIRKLYDGYGLPTSQQHLLDSGRKSLALPKKRTSPGAVMAPNVAAILEASSLRQPSAVSLAKSVRSVQKSASGGVVGLPAGQPGSTPQIERQLSTLAEEDTAVIRDANRSPVSPRSGQAAYSNAAFAGHRTDCEIAQDLESSAWLDQMVSPAPMLSPVVRVVRQPLHLSLSALRPPDSCAVHRPAGPEPEPEESTSPTLGPVSEHARPHARGLQTVSLGCADAGPHGQNRTGSNVDTRPSTASSTPDPFQIRAERPHEHTVICHSQATGCSGDRRVSGRSKSREQLYMLSSRSSKSNTAVSSGADAGRRQLEERASKVGEVETTAEARVPAAGSARPHEGLKPSVTLPPRPRMSGMLGASMRRALQRTFTKPTLDEGARPSSGSEMAAGWHMHVVSHPGGASSDGRVPEVGRSRCSAEATGSQRVASQLRMVSRLGMVPAHANHALPHYNSVFSGNPRPTGAAQLASEPPWMHRSTLSVVPSAATQSAQALQALRRQVSSITATAAASVVEAPSVRMRDAQASSQAYTSEWLQSQALHVHVVAERPSGPGSDRDVATHSLCSVRHTSQSSGGASTRADQGYPSSRVHDSTRSSSSRGPWPAHGAPGQLCAPGSRQISIASGAPKCAMQRGRV